MVSTETLIAMKLGLAVTGSFCTFSKILPEIDNLKKLGFDITPIFSFNVANLDTRFFKASDFFSLIEEKTGQTPITTIVGSEPLGTATPLDIMLVAPCTGNTLAKIAGGITDTPVTMAVKAHLRNNRPVVLSLATNDALGANAKNFGLLINTKNIYFVPLGQDAPHKKSNSLISNTTLITETCLEALNGKQLQPVLL